MAKAYLKKHERANIVMKWLVKNPKSTAKEIASGTGFGLSNVYKIIDELGNALDRDRVKASIHHCHEVFSINLDMDKKVVVRKATDSFRIPSRDPITSALFGTRA